jgi:hypothetical protein
MDTILTVPSVNKKEYFLDTKINSGDSQNVLIPGSKKQWLYDIQKGKDSTLSIFVFRYNDVKASNWDSLRLGHIYHRFDYRLKKLEDNNWRVEIR